jgi:hypothetical protein
MLPARWETVLLKTAASVCQVGRGYRKKVLVWRRLFTLLIKRDIDEVMTQSSHNRLRINGMGKPRYSRKRARLAWSR